MNKQGLSLKGLTDQATQFLTTLQHYSVLLFVVVVAILYGYLAYTINSLSSAEPAPDAVSSQVKAARIPHIDADVLTQLKKLQDNSVNVRTLFNDSRQNPFQE